MSSVDNTKLSQRHSHHNNSLNFEDRPCAHQIDGEVYRQDLSIGLISDPSHLGNFGEPSQEQMDRESSDHPCDEGVVAAGSDSRRLKIPCLDGIRGFLALYVTFYHACQHVDPRYTDDRPPSPLREILVPFCFGHYAVSVFIVLSGICLMLPVLQTGGHLSGGIVKFLGRRAKRILPPYYAALAVCLLSIAMIPALQRTDLKKWEGALPALTADVIGAHLLLVHNLNRDWIYKIDPPMWTVATEWQIYFAFPLLLLPIWRRFGTIATVSAAVLLSVVPRIVIPAIAYFDLACPWYLGLFAIGMAGAVVTNAARKQPKRELVKRLSLIVTLVILSSSLLVRWRFQGCSWLQDLLLGTAACAFIVYLMIPEGISSPRVKSFVLGVLESRGSIWLGAISYSLYLSHYPVLALMSAVFKPGPLSSSVLNLAYLGVASTTAVFFAYLFYLVFERPFVRK